MRSDVRYHSLTNRLNEHVSSGKMNSQMFDWGLVRWVHEPQSPLEKMMVGHFVFYPQKMDPPHTHSGDEQIIYIIAGTGEHYVNGVKQHLEPGMIVHVPPYVAHQFSNSGDTQLEMIIVYAFSQGELHENLQSETLQKALVLSDFIKNGRFQEMVEKLAQTLQLQVVVVDHKGRPITGFINQPLFCTLNFAHCNLLKVRRRKIGRRIGPELVPCCYELVRRSIPITFGDRFLGSIECGPVFLKEPDPDFVNRLKMPEDIDEKKFHQLLAAYRQCKVVPKSSLYANGELLQSVAMNIVELGNKFWLESQLASLEKQLAETRLHLIKSQIQPHFLYNSLNLIAELAYLEGAREAVEVIGVLCDLLRASLKSTPDFVMVKEELECIKQFLYIQQKRYSDKLSVNIDIAPGMMAAQIPAMMLQPIVENAVVHGIEVSVQPGEISITGRKEKQYLRFEIRDNGVGMSQAKVRSLMSQDVAGRQQAGIGLKNVCLRLKHLFGGDYQFLVESELGSGTTVTLILPQISKGDEAEC